MERYAIHYNTPLGTLALTADDRGITSAAFINSTAPTPPNISLAPVLRQAIQWLDDYFSGSDPGDPPPLYPAGTAFQQQAWQLAQKIPYGCTLSYGALANQLAAAREIPKMSAQAIGGAMKRNPIVLFIPCHRVVAANGLGGYFAHPERKRALLALEGVDVRLLG